MKSNPCSPQLENAHAQQQRPNAAINQLINQSVIVKTDVKELFPSVFF